MILSIFTRDFRLNDNFLLNSKEEILPLFILDEYNSKEHGIALKSIFFKYVYEFNESIKKNGKILHIINYSKIEEFISKIKPKKILYSLDPEPRNRERFENIKRIANKLGIEVEYVWQFPTKPMKWSFNSFSHFYKSAFNKSPELPDYNIEDVLDRMVSVEYEELIDIKELLRNLDNSIIDRYYKPEQKIIKDLINFLNNIDYSRYRDYPAIEGVSKISVYLRVGAISHSRAILLAKNNERYISEIAWSDFYRLLLWNFPNIINEELNPKWRKVDWEKNDKFFEAWKEGETGIDFVDAGMKQLKKENWMHNRLRMIVASFLTKNLRIDWRLGERYFYNMLIDADLAQNVGNWQWVAGCGTDRTIFRIFNPELQRQKFDPENKYTSKYITYPRPKPIIDLDESRKNYLDWIKKNLKK